MESLYFAIDRWNELTAEGLLSGKGFDMSDITKQYLDQKEVTNKLHTLQILMISQEHSNIDNTPVPPSKYTCRIA